MYVGGHYHLLERPGTHIMIRSSVTVIMKVAVAFVAVSLLFGHEALAGQSSNPPSSTASSNDSAQNDTSQTPSADQMGGVEVLSDTQGINFGPYLRPVLQTIKKMWVPLIPAEARPPVNAQGETVIRFKIAPDGKITAMHIDASSQQPKMDRAAWGSITGVGQFPPLPAEFKGPYLELRISFRVNLPPKTTHD
jgi:TonB family protein